MTTLAAVSARLAKSCVRLVIEALFPIVPTGRHVVVHGTPVDEGNSVEVLRWLADNYAGRVYWLISEKNCDVAWLLDGTDKAERVVRLPTRSLRALAAYLTAEQVYFTHGLYQSPRPRGRRLFVNLWHGDGPKRSVAINSTARYPRSSLLVCGSTAFGQEKAAAFRMTPEQLVVSGNPRIDQFARPATDGQLAALGVAADRPFVVWAPTFRRAEGRAGPPTLEGSVLTTTLGGDPVLAIMPRVAAELGLSAVVKAHPLDVDDFRDVGMPLVTNEDLRRNRATLGGFLARSSGLITDYSSIWLDYLALDKPIAYVCPDVTAYAADRGITPMGLATVAAGPMLRTAEDLRAFLRCVAGHVAGSVQIRQQRIRELGVVTKHGATRRLMAAVGHPRALAPVGEEN